MLLSHEVFQHVEDKNLVMGVIDTMTADGPIFNGETITCYNLMLQGAVEVPLDDIDEAISLETALSMFCRLYGEIEIREHQCSPSCKYHMSTEQAERMALRRKAIKDKATASSKLNPHLVPLVPSPVIERDPVPCCWRRDHGGS